VTPWAPVIVVGGGQAGLAMSYCLKQRGITTSSSSATASRTTGVTPAGTPSAS